MLKLVLVGALCLSFVSCDTLFFRPSGGGGKSDDDSNPLCPDKQGSCPKKSTCCATTSGKYGCCPLPDAVCCPDLTHCCPKGFKCDSTTSTCTNGALTIDWLHQITPSNKPQPGQGLKQESLKRKNVGVSDVVCPGGKVECPNSNTCCQLGDTSYGCCPMAAAVCCDDHAHCCPKGFKCNKGTCSQVQGQGSAAWMQLVLGKNKVSKSSKITSEKHNPNKVSHNPRTATTTTKDGTNQHRKQQIPDSTDEDNDPEEMYPHHKGKMINIKGKVDGKNVKNIPKSEIVKPKPVSKKAKENINVKKDIPGKGGSQPTPAAAAAAKAKIAALKQQPAAAAKAKPMPTAAKPSVPPPKVVPQPKQAAKTPPKPAEGISKEQLRAASIKKQMEDLQAKGRAQLLLKQQQQAKAGIPLKVKQPAVPGKQKPVTTDSKRGDEDENGSVLNLNFVPAGVKKLIQKLSENVKKVLVDSLLDSDASDLDHPTENLNIGKKGSKKVQSDKSKNQSKPKGKVEQPKVNVKPKEQNPKQKISKPTVSKENAAKIQEIKDNIQKAKKKKVPTATLR